MKIRRAQLVDLIIVANQVSLTVKYCLYNFPRCMTKAKEFCAISFEQQHCWKCYILIPDSDSGWLLPKITLSTSPQCSIQRRWIPKRWDEKVKVKGGMSWSKISDLTRMVDWSPTPSLCDATSISDGIFIRGFPSLSVFHSALFCDSVIVIYFQALAGAPYAANPSISGPFWHFHSALETHF